MRMHRPSELQTILPKQTSESCIAATIKKLGSLKFGLEGLS